MPLTLQDFASFKANWLPKADNIEAMSMELGVKFSEMVFVDNSPEQRDEVRAIGCRPWQSRNCRKTQINISRPSERAYGSNERNRP